LEEISKFKVELKRRRFSSNANEDSQTDEEDDGSSDEETLLSIEDSRTNNALVIN
jgi:hypothetical protein